MKLYFFMWGRWITAAADSKKLKQQKTGGGKWRHSKCIKHFNIYTMKTQTYSYYCFYYIHKGL